MDPLIKRCSDCDKSWVERYSEATESERIEIFNREDFRESASTFSDTIFLNPLCTLICRNCYSYLCEKDNLCEYALNLSNKTE